MVIYNNEFKTKGNKFYNKDKIESQQVHYKACNPWVPVGWISENIWIHKKDMYKSTVETIGNWSLWLREIQNQIKQ